MTRNRERMESQSSNDRDDPFHNNGTNGDIIPWSSQSTGSCEMGKVNGNRMGNTSKGKIDEEMISLTSPFDAELD